jgi:hypothetical protein
MAGLGVDSLPAPEIAAHLRHHAARLKLSGAAYFGGLSIALVGISWIAGRFQGQILVVMLVTASVVGLGWGYWTGKLPRKAFYLGLCLTLMADLIPLARTFFVLEDPETSFLKSSPALDLIAAQPGLFRTYATHGELSYAAAAARGIETLDGALSFQIEHAVEIIKAASGCELKGFATGVPPCLTSEIDKDAYQRSQPNAALLGLLNVKYVVSSFSLRDPAFTPVAEADGITVYVNEKWLPRGFVVGKVEWAPDQNAALADLRRNDPAEVAFVVDPAVPAADLEAAMSLRPAEVIERQSGYYRLATPGPGWLVFSETWAPGWYARLNGVPVPLYRTDYALLGVYVPAGHQIVELGYTPLGWRIGWPMTVAGLGGLALWAMRLKWQSLRLNRRLH